MASGGPFARWTWFELMEIGLLNLARSFLIESSFSGQKARRSPELAPRSLDFRSHNWSSSTFINLTGGTPALRIFTRVCTIFWEKTPRFYDWGVFFC